MAIGYEGYRELGVNGVPGTIRIYMLVSRGILVGLEGETDGRDYGGGRIVDVKNLVVKDVGD